MPLVSCKISMDIDMGAVLPAGFEGLPRSSELILADVVGTNTILRHPVFPGVTVTVDIGVIAEDAEAGEVFGNEAHLDLPSEGQIPGSGNEVPEYGEGSVVCHAGNIANEEEEPPLDGAHAMPDRFFIIISAEEEAIERRPRNNRVQEDVRHADPSEFDEKYNLTDTNASFHNEAVFIPKESQLDIGSVDDFLDSPNYESQA